LLKTADDLVIFVDFTKWIEADGACRLKHSLDLACPTSERPPHGHGCSIPHFVDTVQSSVHTCR
jgi:hypothetical protein